MKLTTNYSIRAAVSHMSYYTGDESLTIYTCDDEQLEIYGIDRGDVLCFTRNFIICDITKQTSKAQLCAGHLRTLTEIRDALNEYLTDSDAEEVEKAE
jgi:hypothetical protein